MSVKQHYDDHLASIYSWMCGDFETEVAAFGDFLQQQGIVPAQGSLAVDLGAGHGVQSAALARRGFSVLSVDFSPVLLKELQSNCKNYPVRAVQADVREIDAIGILDASLVLCWGDTLTHLSGKDDVLKFLMNCAALLTQGGQLLLSFRDYSFELTGTDRFIPVKADDSRMLTCLLEYSTETVQVTDLVWERQTEGWRQSVSSYRKLRLDPDWVRNVLEQLGFFVRQTVFRGMVVQNALKPG